MLTDSIWNSPVSFFSIFYNNFGPHQEVPSIYYGYKFVFFGIHLEVVSELHASGWVCLIYGLKSTSMNMSWQEEVWRPVTGFERYHVSSFGQVKNYKTGRIMKPYKKPGGYLADTIVEMVGVRSTFLIHRLVALAFLGEGVLGKTVDHIDRNTENNVVTNLRWATPIEQMANTKKRKTSGVQGGRPVWKCGEKTGEKIELFQNLKLAAESTNSTSVNPESMICAAARGRKKSAFGFKWAYEDCEVIEGEEWKPLDPGLVKGQGGYFISTEGRVKNRKGRINTPFRTANGYAKHSIHPHVFAAHRLVAFCVVGGRTREKSGKSQRRGQDQLSRF